MDLYIDAFKAKAKICRGANIGMAQTDDDMLFRLNESLPAAWEQYRAIVSASQMSLEDACSFYLKTARENGALPGTCKKGKRAMGSVHVTDSVKELCRDNAKGAL